MFHENVGKNESEMAFWEVRAKKYNELEWVNNESYLELIKEVGEFWKEDYVLDVGTGTGMIARTVSPLVHEVIGVDISPHMLERGKWSGNMYCVRRDIRERLFAGETFSKVTARMVFHGILTGTQAAMDECYRVLKKGGRMILAEGVPPGREVREDYVRIFELKEARLTFMEDDLVELMAASGFKDIKVYGHYMRAMSVSNWLEKSGLPQEVQDRIFEMHITAGDYFRKAYNMKIVRGDCLIDMKNAIVVGEK
ncbi:MAG: class I SAM-dependent methyltransferase [Candidatus Methylomirabilales bacterium]